MAEPARRRMTVEEFLAFQGEPDVRYELIEGRPVAMNPPLGFHRTIAMNISGQIWSRLRTRGGCRGESEAGVELTDGNYYVADIAVTCSEPANAGAIPDPVLIIEILSRSTRTEDLGRKIPAFQEIPTVQEIWAVDSERRRVSVWHREGGRWVMDTYVGGSRFASGVLGADILLDELYEKTTL